MQRGSEAAKGVRRRDITDEVFARVWADVQRENPLGGYTEAARRLGITKNAVRSRVKTLERSNALPRTQGMAIAGSSTLYGADGNVVLQWVKETSSKANPDEWAKIVKEVFADTEPVKPIPKPKCRETDLMTVYPIGDQHHGMRSWREETGADWDVKISEKTLVAAAQYLVEVAPATKRAMIVNVGDFFHVDGLRAETAQSKHALDVDTRYALMIRGGIRMLRACVESALAKHESVELVNATGNHSHVGELWLSLTLACLYEKNPRVIVRTEPGKFHYTRHGKVLIGVTHGDTVKMEALPGVMATDRPQDWGETRHRYWLTGHIHHRRQMEFNGCVVESFRTLAASDAWASGAGYRAGRDMTAVVFDREFGEVERRRFDAAMCR